MDTLSPEKRSLLMSRVRQRHTKPEKLVRSLLHSLGFRFRLHKKELPGTPDIVLPKYKTVIFVHGCFWHQHIGCRKSRRPTSKVDFWNQKLDRNMERDADNIQLLKEKGWKSIIVWECELRQIDNLADKLSSEISL